MYFCGSFSIETEGGQSDLDEMRTDLSWPKTFVQGTKQSPNQTRASVQRKGSRGGGGWGQGLRKKNIRATLLFLTRSPAAKLSRERPFMPTSRPSSRKSRSQLIGALTWFPKKEQIGEASERPARILDRFLGRKEGASRVRKVCASFPSWQGPQKLSGVQIIIIIW